MPARAFAPAAPAGSRLPTASVSTPATVSPSALASPARCRVPASANAAGLQRVRVAGNRNRLCFPASASHERGRRRWIWRVQPSAASAKHYGAVFSILLLHPSPGFRGLQFPPLGVECCCFCHFSCFEWAALHATFLATAHNNNVFPHCTRLWAKAYSHLFFPFFWGSIKLMLHA